MLKCVFASLVALAMFASTAEAQVMVPFRLAKASLSSTNLVSGWTAPAILPRVRTMPAAIPAKRVAPPVLQQADSSLQLIGYDQCGRPVYRGMTASDAAAPSPTPTSIASPQPQQATQMVPMRQVYPRLYSASEPFEDPFEAD